ncbi:MAG: threonine/serine exporter family protein, partial [Lachnospiraceae bacterium]|nr:threonine/serine exporter family protein [Lachnospiraceae bacterium]
IEYILDFAANLGCRMLTVGANLERVNDTMFRICHSYRLSSISIFSLSTIIIISAKSQDGQSGARQISVPHEDKHMEKLNRFNQLSRKVCAETPPPETLARLLDEAEKVSDYSLAAVISGYLIAMTSLGVLNGGTIGDIISADLNTLVLLWLTNFLDKRNINRIVANALCTWIAGTLAVLYVKLGIGEHFFIIVIVNSMLMIPGTALVNAFRNILCGNEMNGILELLKVILETMAIVFGLIVSIYMFGGLISW